MWLPPNHMSSLSLLESDQAKRDEASAEGKEKKKASAVNRFVDKMLGIGRHRAA